MASCDEDAILAETMGELEVQNSIKYLALHGGIFKSPDGVEQEIFSKILLDFPFNKTIEKLEEPQLHKYFRVELACWAASSIGLSGEPMGGGPNDWKKFDGMYDQNHHCQKFIDDAVYLTYFCSPRNFRICRPILTNEQIETTSGRIGDDWEDENRKKFLTLTKFNFIRLLLKHILDDYEKKYFEEDGPFNPIFQIKKSATITMNPGGGGGRSSANDKETEKNGMTILISQLYTKIMKNELKSESDILSAIDKSPFGKKNEAHNFELKLACGLLHKFVREGLYAECMSAGPYDDKKSQTPETVTPIQWGLNAKSFTDFTATIRTQYDADSWEDHAADFKISREPGPFDELEEMEGAQKLMGSLGFLKTLQNLSNWQIPRYYQSGCEPAVELCAVLEGIFLHRHERWQDKNMRRLKFLLVNATETVHDFFSLVNDLQIASKSKEIWDQMPGAKNEISTLIAQAETDLRRFNEEAKECVKNLKIKHHPNSHIMNYVRLMLEMTEGVVSLDAFQYKKYRQFCLTASEQDLKDDEWMKQLADRCKEVFPKI